ncbi:uncharacterized protein LOC101894028 [Musca domestica]|uniref:Uncharacterized protein LOC101894028 n=1 Tax=Musca domestica TaxID=7370 RepID=A0A1I8MFX1_MUSDO|nr:uncharacterized protein LOC101894028 [Musca domestica]XP_058980553.1 uncharacterized protein LOC101894028 [Musca domestica]
MATVIKSKMKMKVESAVLADKKINKNPAFNVMECKPSPVASRTRQRCKTKNDMEKEQLPPPELKPEPQYTFEMLHEDDPTDEEESDDEITLPTQRPPPPSWSLARAREPYVLKQEYTPTDYVDSFFSVEPMTPDLRIMFPNIHARYLKRRSSAFWSTPPRYSELPRY